MASKTTRWMSVVLRWCLRSVDRIAWNVLVSRKQSSSESRVSSLEMSQVDSKSQCDCLSLDWEQGWSCKHDSLPTDGCRSWSSQSVPVSIQCSSSTIVDHRQIVWTSLSRYETSICTLSTLSSPPDTSDECGESQSIGGSIEDSFQSNQRRTGCGEKSLNFFLFSFFVNFEN